MRHIACSFEKRHKLRPPPTPLGNAIETANYKRTALSGAQATQIREIFELFDTDGGGCIDQKELQFAMTALGFQTQENQRGDKHQEALEVMNTLVDDGKVTLEEFTALMTGELSGQDPYEEARSAFALLSRPDKDSQHDGFITLGKLEAVCQELQVVLISSVAFVGYLLVASSVFQYFFYFFSNTLCLFYAFYFVTHMTIAVLLYLSQVVYFSCLAHPTSHPPLSIEHNTECLAGLTHFPKNSSNNSSLGLSH